MEKTSAFDHAALAKKMVSKFGTSQESVKVDMRYSKEVQTFVCKVEDAHKKAAESKLVFG